MGQFVRTWVMGTAIVVACWRGLSELVARMRELAATGELALRVEARRLQQVSDALVRAHAREAARVPVLVGGGVATRAPRMAAMPDVRCHASVQVGAVRDADIDDVGLLEGAMRRAASERMDVAATGIRRRAVRRARRAAGQGGSNLAAELLAAAPAAIAADAASSTRPEPRSATRAPRRAPAPERRRPSRSAGPRPVPAPTPAPPSQSSTPAMPVRPPRRDGGWTDWRWLATDEEVEALGVDPVAATWPLVAVLCGAMLTFVPLVRPLAEPAPWLAVAGLALVLAGWIGSRRA